MRKVIGLLVVVALTAAACGGDDGGTPADPAAANSCEELADVGIAMIQDVIDEIGEMSMAEFMEAASGDEPPEAIARFEAQGEAMERRAEELGCSETDAELLMCDRIDQLEANTEVGQLLLASIAAGCGG